MANFKRKKPRASMGIGSKNDLRREFGNGWHWWKNIPTSHNIVYHHRPKRRETKALLGKVLKGYDYDDIVWPVSRKPHVYYW